MPPALPPNSRASAVVCRLPIPNNRPSFSSGRLRRLFPHFALLRVDAAWPRLGRAFRTAPVSRQTNPNRVWHSPRFPSRPATLPPAFVLSLRPCRLVFPRCRSGERKNKPTPAEGKKHEIRRSQPQDQRSSQLPRAIAGGGAE